MPRTEATRRRKGRKEREEREGRKGKLKPQDEGREGREGKEGKLKPQDQGREGREGREAALRPTVPEFGWILHHGVGMMVNFCIVPDLTAQRERRGKKYICEQVFTKAKQQPSTGVLECIVLTS